MPAIVVKAVGGMRPIVEPHLLDPSEGVLARNMRIVSGAIEPLRGSTTLQATSVASPQTIWRYGNAEAESSWWFQFAGDVDIIRSPIADDPYGRAYWSDGGAPRYGPSSVLISGASYPGSSYILGLPAPATAPSLAYTPDATATAETRSYVITYVTAYGEEGPPSSPTAPVSIDPEAAVTLSGMATGPSGAYNVTLKRIYRTSTVGSSAEFQFVAEIPVAQSTYADTVSQALLGEVLPSLEWEAPPSGLKGMKMLANGAAIGFKGNTVYLSEPNLPHAWPHKVPLDAPIVGIGVFRDGAAILTNGHPYLLTGADPSAMTPQRLELPHACVSKRGIADTGDGCIYPSAAGLITIGSGGMADLTQKLLSDDQWRAYNPSSMFGSYFDGRYYCRYQKTSGERGILIFDLRTGALSVTDINATTDVTAMYFDPRSGTLYMAQGGNIVRHDKGTNLTATWRSGKYRLARPANMSCVAATADAYPVIVRVYADGALVRSVSITDPNARRLPGGFEARDWELEVEASTKVTRVAMATSIGELMAAQ